MPANLTPQYYEAEEAFKKATTKNEKIAALEEMLAVMPKHKGTDKLQAELKKKLSKIRKSDDNKGGNVQDDPYLVEKQGAGQVVIVGFPNAGKSSIVKSLTNARIEVAEYPFTTNLPEPGMMPYKDIKIQLVDTPPLTEEGIPGPFMNTIRNADLLILTINAGSDKCLDHLEMLLEFLREKRLLRDELVSGVKAFTFDECLVVSTGIDIEESNERLNIVKEMIPSHPDIFPISNNTGENLEEFREVLFNRLGIVRIYTKEPGKKADLKKPFVLKKGSTVIDLANHVHRDIAENLQKARVWGSARFDGQPVARDYKLEDGDVVELHT